MHVKNWGSFLGWFFVGATALGGAVVACGSSNFSTADGDGGTNTTDATLDDGSPDSTESPDTGDHGEPDGAEPDSSHPHNDGGADATQQPDGMPPPLVDGGDCTAVPNDTTGAIVSIDGGGPLTATGCTLATPCAKLQDGIDYAESHNLSTIYVDQGTYAEAITLSNGTTAPRILQGGWKRDPGGTHAWTRDCSPQATSLVFIKPPATPGLDTTVTAKNLAGTFTLQEVNIQSRNGAVAPGESFYGIVASGSTTHLELLEVGVTVAGGGAGSDGNQGTAGAAAPATAACAPGTGGTPAAGGNGTPGPNGSYGPSGFTPAGGGPAGPGGPGGNGAKNNNPPVCSSNCYDGICAEPDCTGGAKTSCGADGLNGCGSGGSGGGTGGTGGGSSIGVYVTAGASVNAKSTNVATGAGGAGGAGGAAGAVSAPSPGTTGAVGCCKTQCPFKSGVCGKSICDPTVVLSGGVGTAGAAGSVGGVGGGGAGGDSYGYYTAGGTFTEGAAFSAIPGAAGSPTGANPGAPGRSAPHN